MVQKNRSTRQDTGRKQLLLRLNAGYLGGASLVALIFDILGAFAGTGLQGRILMQAPHAAIGFVEAHGLAFILSILLWRAAPARRWHLTAFAIEFLLGTANLAFWPIFVAADSLALGYVTTTLHWLFAALHLTSALRAEWTLGKNVAIQPDQPGRHRSVASQLFCLGAGLSGAQTVLPTGSPVQLTSVQRPATMNVRAVHRAHRARSDVALPLRYWSNAARRITGDNS